MLRVAAICVASLVSSTESVRTEARTVDDYIGAIRKAAKIPEFSNHQTDSESLVELENLKKPLTVSQFSEWLHNLYYDEEKKRQSAIKYMLENQFGKAQ